MKSIIGQVLENAAANPEKLALCNAKEECSYGLLRKRALGTGVFLNEEYGLRKGDTVILSADKQPEFVYVYLACHLSGIRVAPIAPDTNPKRLDYIMEKTNPKLVMGMKSETRPCIYAAFQDVRERMPKIENKTIAKDEISLPNLDDVSDIIFTTGTTGDAKGVLLTHRNMAAAARNINTFIGNQTDDTEILALPICHSFGLGRMRCVLSNGQTLVLSNSFVMVQEFFQLLEKYHVSGFGMVPASWAILKKMSKNKIAEYAEQLHYIEIGSAPMATEEKERLATLLPDTRICMHYGLTEASRSAFMEFHRDRDYYTTIGKPSPNISISVRDENGDEVGANVEGELCIKGDAVMSGYLNPADNENAYYGEWFRTGDWGSVDENGYIRLKSRKKELINVGGKKVSPLEVEEALQELDFIEDCACVGMPDPRGIQGEVVKAFVVTKQPEKLVKKELDALLGQSLEVYKLPNAYEVIDEVPKTASGKVQRLVLK